jgi:hypothetical protein
MMQPVATLPEAAALADADRAAILRYATWLLPVRDRADPEVVTRAAAPLLRWAQDAVSKDDLRARMAAMSREHDNSSPVVTEPVDPEGFLTRARVYYEFITGVTR